MTQPFPTLPPAAHRRPSVAAPYGPRFTRSRKRDPLMAPIAKTAIFGVAVVYFLAVLLWTARVLF